ncbi:MAG: hypothetical protein J6I41_05155 [Bacteroidales bacterium]|nr:hypothetical protein [Bacteroidales bacterium]
MRKASTFDAQSATTATVAFFKRWWKLLTIVFVCAAIVSAVVSLFIKPMYLATGVMMPTNSNRLTKAIMDYDYSMDFMDYGAERDCEYAQQVLTSKQMELAVCNRFNLIERYDIKPTSKHKLYDVGKKYNRYLTIKRTDFMGIEVAIIDRDPQTAADIVNYIMDKYDTLCHEIHHDRAESAAEVMSAVCAAAVDELDSVAADTKEHPWKNQLVSRKCKKLAEMQARAVQTSVDKDMSVHYRYVVDRAIPADKKDRPKRGLIVLGCSVGTLVVCIFGLLLFVPRKEEDEE